MANIRQPLITVLGNVDSGKTQLLDTIRNTTVLNTEPGKITQMISSSYIPIETIKKICTTLIKETNITIPGLLTIDTPGHAAFNNLRKRGGNLADIAIVVIDINEGMKPQTIESIEILKNYKTPFVIALNKIDLLSGWKKNPKLRLLKNIEAQSDAVRDNLNKKLYETVGSLYELGFNSERFDKLEDYTKQLAIIPMSAKTSEGIPELLMVLIGMSQKYLEDNLKLHVKGDAKGTILEVNDEKGLGLTLNVILYDGSLKVNDTIVIGTLTEPIVTKVRALFEPEPLSVMKKSSFRKVNQVTAAVGVKISAPNVKNVIAGMPIISATKNVEEVKSQIKKEVKEVIIRTDKAGIIVKANSLGSLEALVSMLKEKKVLIKHASVGEISKKDINEAISEKNELNKVILGFNLKSVTIDDIKIITHDVIYRIIEDFEKYQEEAKILQERKLLESVIRPFKIKILPKHIFRQSNPAVVGIEVITGTLVKSKLIRQDGSRASYVKEIQHQNKAIEKAKQGEQVAIAIPNVTINRQIKEEDILYSDIDEEQFKRLKNLKNLLNSDEIETLKEIAKIKRKEHNLWGV